MTKFEPVAFGRYFLLDHVGRGGMADIYLAVRIGERGFEKPLVVKRIRSDLFDDRMVDLLSGEARVAALLDHPNIVQVYDFGQVDSDYYVAMEWVNGKSLLQLLQRLNAKRRSLATPYACHIAAEVASGLDFAHGMVDHQGAGLAVVHRDVTPSNILLSYAGNTKLGDFGIAKILGASDSTDGLVAGKVGYMSPEQGLGQPVDARSDVFGLGVVLYELLAGRRLFPSGMTPSQIVVQVKEGLAPPSSANPSVDPLLDRVVMRALALDPERRYSSCAAFRDELRGLAERWPRGVSNDDLAGLMDRLFHGDRAEERASHTAARKALATLRNSAGMPEGPISLSGIVVPPEVLSQPLDEGLTELAPPVRVKAPAGSRLSQVLNATNGQAPSVPAVLKALREEEGDSSQSGTILVVDDLAANRDLLVRALKRDGYQVTEANDGYQTVAAVEEGLVDLVLLDINMPGMDGYAVLEEIRRRHPMLALPIIMVTARDTSDDVVTALRMGANDYLSKPVDLDILRARVRTQLLVAAGFATLQAVDARCRILAEASTDLIFQVTASGTVLFASPAAKRLVGVEPAALVETIWYERVHRADLRDVKQAFDDVLAGHTRTCLHRVRHADGHHLWLEANVGPLVEPESGWITGIQGSARDVTKYVAAAAADEPPLPGGRDVVTKPGWRGR